MAVVRLKDPQNATVRTITLNNSSGVRCEAHVEEGNHTVISDEPEERGGTGQAPAPLMYFTASLGTCQAVQIRKVAKAMRIELGDINIKVSTTTDRIPGVDKDNKVMRFCAAEMDIEIETDASPEKIERLKVISEDQCPVGNLFTDAGYEPVVNWSVRPLKH